VLTQLARAEGLLGRYDAAHSTLDQVLADLRPELPVARVRYLLERGRVYNSSGQPGRALPLFHDAWEAARAAAVDHLAIDAAHMIALCESGAEVGRWNREALDLASRSAEVRARRWRGSILNNMGWSAFQAEDFGLALDLFRQALRAREEDGKPKEIRVARWCVGRALRALHRTSEALQMQQSLAKDLVAAGERDGYVSEEIGECLLALGRGAEAAPHFAAAWRELRRDGWLVDHEGARLERLRTLGGVPPAP
jgi:tetratricopeptide (TPR) repeat protein